MTTTSSHGRRRHTAGGAVASRATRSRRIACGLAAAVLAVLVAPAAPAGAAVISTPTTSVTVTGTVNTTLIDGTRDIVGGAFTHASGRNNLLAATGGVIDTGFDANVNGTVFATLRAGSKLYIGGQFTMVNGTVARSGLAAIDITTGAVDTTFVSPVQGTVRALVLSGNTLYAGGSYALAGGGFGNLGAFDATTGARMASFNPQVGDLVRALALSGDRLYVGGQFQSLNGGVTRNRIAAVDATTGVVDPAFDPSAGATVTSIVLADGVVYLGGTFALMNTNTASVLRNHVAAVDPVTGRVTAYDPNVGGDVNALAWLDGVVYVGGSFSNVHNLTVPRANLAAFSGGIVDPTFNPGGTVVQSLTASGNALSVGGAGAMRRFSQAATPPQAASGAASAITPATATLAGTVNPGGAAATYTFEYGTTSAFGAISPVASTGAGSTAVPVTASLAGLQADTTYYYRLVASSAAGTAFGLVRTFRTTGGPTLPDAVTLGASNLTNTSATIAGQVNPRGQVSSYTFEYGTTLSFGAITTVRATDDANALEPVNAALTGLSPNTTYYYRLVATNGSGTAVGTVMRFTTTGPGGPPTALTGDAAAIAPTSATLTGTVNPSAIATVFTFSYGTSPGDLGAITAVDNAETTGGTQAVSLPATGLAAGTTYYYRLIATNALGTSLGQLRSFTTAAPPT